MVDSLKPDAKLQDSQPQDNQSAAQNDSQNQKPNDGPKAESKKRTWGRNSSAPKKTAPQRDLEDAGAAGSSEAAQGGQVGQASPGGQAAQSPQGGQVTQASPGGQAAQSPQGGQVGQASPGGQAAQSPQGGQVTQASPGGQAAQSPQGGQVGQGAQASQSSAGGGTAQNTPGGQAVQNGQPAQNSGRNSRSSKPRNPQGKQGSNASKAQSDQNPDAPKTQNNQGQNAPKAQSNQAQNNQGANASKGQNASPGGGSQGSRKKASDTQKDQPKQAGGKQGQKGAAGNAGDKGLPKPGGAGQNLSQKAGSADKGLPKPGGADKNLSQKAGSADKGLPKKTGVAGVMADKGQPKPGGRAKAPAKKEGAEKSAAKNIGSVGPKKRQSGESKLKIIPLGGLGEIGKNMTVIQYDNSIIVVDAGIMFPEDELLGIDMVIPDYTYLQENREKLKGFIISHGHEDHIGAIPYMVREFPGVPIYASRLTWGLVNGKIKEHRLNAKNIELRPRAKVQIGPFVLEPLRVAHSIPDSLGFAIHTPMGVIMMISDFKLDMSPIDGEQTDLGSISRLGEQGVLLLMMDSTNVEKEGYTPSERTIGGTFDKVLRASQGRVLITSFASNVHRIQQAIWAADKCGRKVAIIGRGMLNVSTISKELGYLDIPADIVIDAEKADLLPPEKVLILTTGSQGEPMSGLSRMSTGDHRQVHIVPGDVVVISATPVPGNERSVGHTIDNLYRLGAHVIYEKVEGIHVSGHANKEELRLILNIVKPKYFMPIHGEYRMLYKHALLAQELGIPEENTFVMENGQVLELGDRRCRVAESVTAGRILIDGFGIGDVGNAVLRERKMLSEGGIVVVNILYSKKTGKIVHGPEIFTKGFIFEKDSEHIIGETRNRIASICTKNTVDGKVDWNGVRGQLRTNLSYFINDRTGRRPMVLPVITQV